MKHSEGNDGLISQTSIWENLQLAQPSTLIMLTHAATSSLVYVTHLRLISLKCLMS